MKITDLIYVFAQTWLIRHYKDMQEIWDVFCVEIAGDKLVQKAAERGYGSFDDFSELDLLSILADAKSENVVA